MNEIFEPGQYLRYTGETGVRWINLRLYVYLGNGCITDRDGDISKPTWPNFLEDNFEICNNWYNRDFVVSLTDKADLLHSCQLK